MDEFPDGFLRLQNPPKIETELKHMVAKVYTSTIVFRGQTKHKLQVALQSDVPAQWALGDIVHLTIEWNHWKEEEKSPTRATIYQSSRERDIVLISEVLHEQNESNEVNRRNVIAQIVRSIVLKLSGQQPKSFKIGSADM